MEAMNTVSQKVETLKKAGYTEDFYFEKGLLKTEKKSFESATITIENEFRFEGKSNPDDLSIVYQIKANDGTKGTIVDGFGPSANEELTKFLLEAES